MKKQQAIKLEYMMQIIIYNTFIGKVIKIEVAIAMNNNDILIMKRNRYKNKSIL